MTANETRQGRFNTPITFPPVLRPFDRRLSMMMQSSR